MSPDRVLRSKDYLNGQSPAAAQDDWVESYPGVWNWRYRPFWIRERDGNFYVTGRSTWAVRYSLDAAKALCEKWASSQH